MRDGKTRCRLCWALELVLVFCLAGLVLSGGAVRVDAGVDTVALSGPGAYGEDDDYFTTVWGNPRDMDDPQDLYLLHSSCGPTSRAKWASSTFADGLWRGVTGEVGESRAAYLLNPGWVSSLDVGEDGELRPIDTARYRQLTVRMRVGSGAGYSDLLILWSGDPIGTATPPKMRHFQVQSDGKWHIYTFDLGTDPAWTNAPVVSLRLHFDSLRPGYAVEIDWARLTPPQDRRLSWTGSSLSGSRAQVYVMPGPAFSTQYGDLLVYTGRTPARIDANAKALDIPASFPGGTYRARVVAGTLGLTSADSWTFMPAPRATILAPSYTSGPEYAATVLDNPWDMGNVGDVDPDTTEMDGIQSLRVTDGVLTVITRDDGKGSCSAPWPHRPLGLNLWGQRIDTKQYRYLNWRYKVDQAPDQGAGGVHRARWQLQDQGWPTGRTDDISLYNADWNTYHLDLPNVDLEAEGGRWGDFAVDTLQIMLHESHRQWTSHLDWVQLNAENVAQSSYPVRWTTIGASGPVTTTLYWAQKIGSSYQLLPGTKHVIPPSKPGDLVLSYDHTLFLPIMLRQHNPTQGGQFRHDLSTAGLASGRRYYLAIKLEDGYSVTWRYSEVPVLKE